MEVPRLGVESELSLPAYARATAMRDPSCIFDRHHSSWQHQMPSPLSEARDRTRNLMVPSRICFHCAMMGTPRVSFEKVITWVVPHDPTARGLSPSSRLGLGAQSLLSPERLLSISPRILLPAACDLLVHPELPSCLPLLFPSSVSCLRGIPPTELSQLGPPDV